jgi:hypothetical protein
MNMPSLIDDGSKTKTQLLAEIEALRHQLAAMLRTAQIDARSNEQFAVTLMSIGDAADHGHDGQRHLYQSRSGTADRIDTAGSVGTGSVRRIDPAR